MIERERVVRERVWKYLKKIRNLVQLLKLNWNKRIGEKVLIKVVKEESSLYKKQLN